MIPDEMRECIGLVDPPAIYEVEKGAIRRYAEAVGDDNPLYRDAAYASESRYGGIIAPPGFFGWPVGDVPMGGAIGKAITAAMNAGYYRILDAGKSYEFFLPVRPGDTLVGSPQIDDITEKEGKSGPMYIISFKTTFRNQNGDVVANAVQSFICR
jgi:acyl dehydratase